MSVSLLTFSPGVTIKSADVNSNFTGLNTGKLDLTGGTLTGDLAGTNSYFTGKVGAASGLTLDHVPLNGETADSLLIYGQSGGVGTNADVHHKNLTGGWTYFDMKNASAHFDANALLIAAGLVVGGNQTLNAISVFSGTGAGTASHGLGKTPAWVGITDNQNNATMTVGADSYGSTTVHVNAGASHAWIGVAIG